MPRRLGGAGCEKGLLRFDADSDVCNPLDWRSRVGRNQMPIGNPAIIGRTCSCSIDRVTFPYTIPLRGYYAGSMTWTDDDQEMAELRTWLVEQGFVVLSDQLSQGFGDQIVEMARPMGIRLVRDRDQWAIDLLGPDGNWSPLDLWLDRTAGSRRRDLSAAEQSRLLRTHLADLERRASAGDQPNTAE
jgi:hypothetical protein